MVKFEKLDKKKVVVSTIVLWLVSVFYMFLTCGWLFKWVYDLEPKIWLPVEVMMLPVNMVLSHIVTIVGVFFFVVIFEILYKAIPQKGVSKGMVYGFFVFLLGPFVGISSMPLYMTVSTTVIVYWLVSAFVLFLIKGAIVGKIYSKK
jgi:hypothetical protein